MAATTGALHAPFLDGDKVGRKSLVQRAAGLHWPDPTGAALLLAGLAGSACLVDRARGPQAGFAVSLSAGGAPAQRDGLSSSMMLLCIAGALLLIALACQFVFEKVLARAVSQAVNKLLVNCSDFPVELGRMRVWVFPGRVEIRNIFVRSPAGYKSDTLLHLRALSADCNLARCFRRFLKGASPEIRSLQLQGLEVFTEKGGVSGVQSNLQEAITRFEDAQVSNMKPSLFIRKVSVLDVVVKKVGCPGCTKLANIEHADFSNQEEVCSAHQAMVVLLKQLERSIISS